MIIFLLIILSGTAVLANVEQNSASHYGINFWREAEGLPQSRIRAITQTRDGYLWLGTDNGVVRFNGTSFNAYTVETGSLKDNEVWALLEDDEGGLWIGSYGGGLTLLRNGQFTTFTAANGFPDDIVTQLDKDAEGNLWIATLSGLVRYKNGAFTYFTGKDGLENYPISAICARSPLGILISAGNKLYRFSDERFVSVDGIAGEKDGAIEHIIPGKNGSVWFSFREPVIKNWADGKITTYNKQNGLRSHISTIYEDTQGAMWAATDDGLKTLTGDNFVPAPLEADAAAGMGVIYSMFADREGNLWLGLQANGLGRLKVKDISTISVSDGLHNDSTRAVFEDSRKNLWIGTAAGFSRYVNGLVTNYPEAGGVTFGSIRSFAEDNDGNIWIAAGAYLYWMKNGRPVKVPGWSGKFEIKALYKDPLGRMWIGTDGGGMFVYENSEFKNFKAQYGLAGDHIRGFLYDSRGALWISCSGNGLSRYFAGTFTNYSTADGLAGDRVSDIHEDEEGTLWFATRGGLSRFKDEKFFNYTAGSGLFVGSIYTILDDNKGNFWFSCAQGLFRVSKTELRDFAEGRTNKVTSVDYGVRDGLNTRAFNVGNQPAAWKTADGSLMFCSLKGVVVVEPDRISSSQFIAPVYIEDVLINRENHQFKDGLDIPVGAGELEIHFAALSFQAPEKLRFKYMLEGYDRDWVDAGSRRFAYYANLSPGQYRFRVTAGSVDGVWNEKGASFGFYFQPHFYQTWLFFALVILAISLTIGLLYRLRMMGIRARYADVLAERKRIALEIHDTLAQNLAGIALQLDSVNMQLTKMPEELRGNLDQACSLTRYSLSEARRAISDLRSDELENKELAMILPELARKITANSEIEVNLNVTGVQQKLSPVKEKNLLRIFQEALANAVRHSRASNIDIELKYGVETLKLRVADNGEGFDTDHIVPLSVGHYGLIGMHERAERLGGRLELKSAPGRGTELNVELSY